MKTLALLPSICCGPDTAPLPHGDALRLADQFKALADPTRVAIVNRLAQSDESCVCDLTGAFDLAQPTISHHLKVLRDAGLVEATRRGTWAYYRVVPGALSALARALGGDQDDAGERQHDPEALHGRHALA